MMRAIDTARLTVLLACLPCAAAPVERRVDCPPSTAPLISAAPVLGHLDEPWGELREVESSRQKDRSYVLRYDLAGGDAAQLEKWLICRYRDGSYKAIHLPAPTRECRVRTQEDRPADPATKRPLYRVVGITCG